MNYCNNRREVCSTSSVRWDAFHALWTDCARRAALACGIADTSPSSNAPANTRMDCAQQLPWTAQRSRCPETGSVVVFWSFLAADWTLNSWWLTLVCVDRYEIASMLWNFKRKWPFAFEGYRALSIVVLLLINYYFTVSHENIISYSPKLDVRVFYLNLWAIIFVQFHVLNVSACQFVDALHCF